MIVISAERCLGCSICVTVCPEEALKARGLAEVDPQKCTECLICVEYCPVDALEDKPQK